MVRAHEGWWQTAKRLPSKLKPRCKPAPVKFALQASVPTFLADASWTLRDWVNERRHYCAHHTAARQGGEQGACLGGHWLFGCPETHNPEKSMEAHKLLLQTWSMRGAGWRWGDLDALLLSIPQPSGLDHYACGALPHTQLIELH